MSFTIVHKRLFLFIGSFIGSFEKGLTRKGVKNHKNVDVNHKRYLFNGRNWHTAASTFKQMNNNHRNSFTLLFVNMSFNTGLKYTDTLSSPSYCSWHIILAYWLDTYLSICGNVKLRLITVISQPNYLLSQPNHNHNHNTTKKLGVAR